jgi:hypothetical protein
MGQGCYHLIQQKRSVTMRLKTSRTAAEEHLIACLNEGYELRHRLWADYNQLRQSESFTDADNKRYFSLTNDWANSVIRELDAIFPTPLESNRFRDRQSWNAVDYQGINQTFGRLYYSTLPNLIDRLQKILGSDLARYTDFPIQDRLFVEDIDSFRNVRDVNPAMVAHALTDGYLDRSEDQIQLALEQILGVPVHKKDWGGEFNDLYTANVIVNGARTETAFLLKGNGLKRRKMRIADCGYNGDQLVRLFQSPARLFVVQFVGTILEMVIADVAGKVKECQANGKDARFLIMDGQDTARVLHAYKKL